MKSDRKPYIMNLGIIFISWLAFSWQLFFFFFLNSAGVGQIWPTDIKVILILIKVSPFFKKFIYLFIYFWLCWVFVCVRGLSLVAASGGPSSSRCAGLSLSRPLVAEHRLQTRRLSSCGSRAQLLRGMWDLPRPGLEPVSPALAGGFSTTAPPGKPLATFYLYVQSHQIFHPFVNKKRKIFGKSWRFLEKKQYISDLKYLRES